MQCESTRPPSVCRHRSSQPGQVETGRLAKAFIEAPRFVKPSVEPLGARITGHKGPAYFVSCLSNLMAECHRASGLGPPGAALLLRLPRRETER